MIPYGAKAVPAWPGRRSPGCTSGCPGATWDSLPREFRRWPIVNTLLTGLPVPEAASQLGAFAAAHGIDAIVVAGGAKGIDDELPVFAQLKGTKVRRRFVLSSVA